NNVVKFNVIIAMRSSLAARSVVWAQVRPGRSMPAAAAALIRNSLRSIRIPRSARLTPSRAADPEGGVVGVDSMRTFEPRRRPSSRWPDKEPPDMTYFLPFRRRQMTVVLGALMSLTLASSCGDKTLSSSVWATVDGRELRREQVEKMYRA